MKLFFFFYVKGAVGGRLVFFCFLLFPSFIVIIVFFFYSSYGATCCSYYHKLTVVCLRRCASIGKEILCFSRRRVLQSDAQCMRLLVFLYSCFALFPDLYHVVAVLMYGSYSSCVFFFFLCVRLCSRRCGYLSLFFFFFLAFFFFFVCVCVCRFAFFSLI